MFLERATGALLALALVACAHRETPAASDIQADQRARERELSRLQVTQRARSLELLLGSDGPGLARAPFRIVGADDGPVPAFELVAPEGFNYRSQALVGREPFVVVFFATWCDYCGVQLATLRRALDEVEPMQVIPLAADDGDTWRQVPAYLASYGMHQPAVRAKDYPLFSIAYDPSDTVPVVVIVGRSGALIDYHLGYDPAYARRLVGSLRLAHEPGSRGKTSAEQVSVGP